MNTQRLWIHLRLGRVSNLPTVWSNVLAAAVVSGATLSVPGIALALVACSCLYIAGMYLNDACDAEIDAAERPERPIPAGLITRGQVFTGSVCWIVVGLVLFLFAQRFGDGSIVAAIIVPLLLVACIVAYNFHHKGNPFGPALMAGCRALVYLSVGLVLAAHLSAPLVLAATLAFIWIMGLTALAKRESAAHAPTGVWYYGPYLLLFAPMVVSLLMLDRAPMLTLVLCAVLVGIIVQAIRWMRSETPSDFGRGIGVLIAGVAVVDALAIARSGGVWLAVLAGGCALGTVLLQRRVSGT